MIKLINTTSPEYQPTTSVTEISITVDSHADLDELLLVFEQFLHASGYYFKGSITIAEEE